MWMVQKSGEKPTWDGAKTPAINGRNYLSLNWLFGISEPSTV